MANLKVMPDGSEIISYDKAGIPIYVRDGHLSYYPDMRALCHWHEDIEFIYIASGEMLYYINGKTVLLQEGDSIVISYELETLGLFHILWNKIYSYWSSYSKQNSFEDNEELLVQKRMVSYIYQNYTGPLTLTDIAKSGAMSRSKCCIIFKKYLQQSPMDFVNTYRLECSCHLLTTTTLSITQICTTCGFNHLSYFSKMFQDKYGRTPRDYRKLYQTKSDRNN